MSVDLWADVGCGVLAGGDGVKRKFSMEKIQTYQSYIRPILLEYADLLTGYDEVKRQALFDSERDR